MRNAIREVLRQEVHGVELRLREAEGIVKERSSVDTEPGEPSLDAARSIDQATAEVERLRAFLDGAQTIANAVTAEIGDPVPTREKRLRPREDF